jgi:chromosome segregation ATPase
VDGYGCVCRYHTHLKADEDVARAAHESQCAGSRSTKAALQRLSEKTFKLKADMTHWSQTAASCRARAGDIEAQLASVREPGDPDVEAQAEAEYKAYDEAEAAYKAASAALQAYKEQKNETLGDVAQAVQHAEKTMAGFSGMQAAAEKLALPTKVESTDSEVQSLVAEQSSCWGMVVAALLQLKRLSREAEACSEQREAHAKTLEDDSNVTTQVRSELERWEGLCSKAKERTEELTAQLGVAKEAVKVAEVMIMPLYTAYNRTARYVE